MQLATAPPTRSSVRSRLFRWYSIHRNDPPVEISPVPEPPILTRSIPPVTVLPAEGHDVERDHTACSRQRLATFLLLAPDGTSTPAAVVVPAPRGYAVPGAGARDLLDELAWYLEQFLGYPFSSRYRARRNSPECCQAVGTETLRGAVRFSRLRTDQVDAAARRWTVTSRAMTPQCWLGGARHSWSIVIGLGIERHAGSHSAPAADAQPLSAPICPHGSHHGRETTHPRIFAEACDTGLLWSGG